MLATSAEPNTAEEGAAAALVAVAEAMAVAVDWSAGCRSLVGPRLGFGRGLPEERRDETGGGGKVVNERGAWWWIPATAAATAAIMLVISCAVRWSVTE